MKEKDPEFEIYRQIAKYQSTGQDVEELKEEKKKGDERRGWKLDKYKFIHMVDEAFEERPDAKWYMFIETDSYLFYPALSSFLERLDPSKPYYIGFAVSMGSITFAHGGSGYILSASAMNLLLTPEMKTSLAAKWDERTKGYCCGHVALATALKQKGVEITRAHLVISGYKPSTFTYGPGTALVSACGDDTSFVAE